jgi:predicted secreted Zn-dependent protease
MGAWRAVGGAVLPALSLVACAHAPIETLERAPAPGVHLLERAVRYAVRGRTVHALRTEMARIGPIDDGGHQFAKTWGEYAWRYPYARGADGCRTGQVTVELEVTATLPAWLDAARAAAETAREWRRWLAATEQHEDGHRRILVSTAAALVGRLEAVAAQPTCDELDRQAGAAGDALLAQMKAQHAAYDRETQHGATTGALLRADLP